MGGWPELGQGFGSPSRAFLGNRQAPFGTKKVPTWAAEGPTKGVNEGQQVPSRSRVGPGPRGKGLNDLYVPRGWRAGAGRMVGNLARTQALDFYK